MTKKFRKIRNGLLGTLLTLTVAAAVGTYGTFAFFTDTETSASNMFAAGTLDLSLDGAADVDAFIGHANFAPGDTTTGSLVLMNDGSISSFDGDGHTVTLGMDVGLTETDADGGATDMGDYLVVTALTYDGGDLLAGVTDANGNGVKDLSDVAAASFTGLADPGAAGKVLELTVLFDTSAGNSLQGDSVTAGFTFSLGQS